MATSATSATTANAGQPPDAAGRPLVTVCAGGRLSRPPEAGDFPATVLTQTADFAFTVARGLDEAVACAQQPDVELLLVDVDGESIAAVVDLLQTMKRLRPAVPVITFSGRSDDRLRLLMRAGASWHFTKRARAVGRLGPELRRLGLVRAVGAQAPPALANPYVVGKPLVGPAERLFYGREDVVDWVGRNAGGPAPGNALLLYGERRIGKSSLLYQIARGERGRGLRERPGAPLHPIYLDLQRYAGYDQDELLRRLAAEVWRGVGDGDGSVGAAQDAYAALEAALGAAEARLAPATLLLLFDEFEQLQAGVESGRWRPDLLPSLRALVQHRRRAAFLFCGSPGLTGAAWRPFSQLAVWREIGPLEPAAAARLIREPVPEIIYTDAAVEQLLAVTGGRPYPIQLICHSLVSDVATRPGRRIDRPAVDAAVDALRRETGLLTPPDPNQLERTRP